MPASTMFCHCAAGTARTLDAGGPVGAGFVLGLATSGCGALVVALAPVLGLTSGSSSEGVPQPEISVRARSAQDARNSQDMVRSLPSGLPEVTRRVQARRPRRSASDACR